MQLAFNQIEMKSGQTLLSSIGLDNAKKSTDESSSGA